VVGTNGGDKLDYESTTNSFTLDVRATDANNGFSSVYLKISVADVNEAPVFVPDQDSSVGDPIIRGAPESAATGTLIGAPITARDPDRSDTLTYRIVTDDSTYPNFVSMDSTTGQLKAAKQLPAVTSSAITITLTVGVSDGTNTEATNSVEIALTNNNKPPVFDKTTATVSVREDAAAGTQLPSAVTATDPNNHPISYILVSGANGAFVINENSGRLSVASALDYEKTTSYTLTIRAVDVPGGTILPLSSGATVTVNIQDVNEAPTLGGGLQYTLSEATSNGVSIGNKLTVTDPDANEKFTWSITSGNSDGAFEVTPDGQVKVKDASKINFERVPSYALDVQVKDSGGNTATTTFRISIQNANDPPKFAITDRNVSISEAAALGTKLITLQASDEDTGETFSFSITNSVDVFTVSPSSGEVTLAKKLDFETKSSYQLDVKVTDAGGLSDTATLYIQVTDAPDPPSYTGATSVSVEENKAVGTILMTATAADQDTNEAFAWAITAGNDLAIFDIERTTGKLKVRDNSKLNYESYKSFELTLTVTDKDGLTATGKVKVTVTDVNEAPAITTTSLTVAEADGVTHNGRPFYAVTGWPVGTSEVAFTDEDAGQSHTIRIVSGNSYGLFAFGQYVSVTDLMSGAATSPVDASTDFSAPSSGFMLYVRNISALDFEGPLNKQGRTTVSLVVEVTDNGSPAAKATGTIEVEILQRNERPTMEKNIVRKVDENSAVNIVIGDPLVASDPDKGDILAFTIESGNDDGMFKIDPCSGQLKVAKSSLNYEVKNLYKLVVSARDDAGPIPGPEGLFDITNMTVEILDVNEPPKVLPTTRVIPENSIAPMTLGSALVVTDEDIGQVHTWSIVREDSNAVGLFEIDSSTGVLKVKTTKAGPGVGLDFETATSYTITVRATDNGIRPANLYSEAVISIGVTDVNEPPVIAANQNISIPENSVPGTQGDKAVQAFDYDAGSSIRFSIVNDGSLGSRLFVIDPTSGVIRVAPLPVNATGPSHPELDHETMPSTWMRVMVNDSQLTATAIVNIRISDVNEPPSLLPATLNVSEIAAAGTKVTGSPLHSFDVDKGQQVSYRISTQLPKPDFAIDALTGEITVAAGAKLDYETINSYTLTVVGTDDGPGRLVATKTYTVTILDSPEPPVVNAATGTVAENSLGGKSVANVTATDVDVGDTLTFSLVSAVPASLLDKFTVDSATGNVLVKAGTVAGDINYEGIADHKIVLTVKVTDSFGLSDQNLVTLTVTDVPEAPIWSPPSVVYKKELVAGSVGEPFTSYVMDEDANEVFSFDLIGVSPSDPGFALDNVGTLLVPDETVASSLHFGDVYTFSLRISDKFGLSTLGQLVVEITKNNVPPTLGQLEVSINENPSAGMTLATVQADDQNAGQDVTYRIAPVGASLNQPFPFNITTIPRAGAIASGRIFVTDPSIVDYEKRPVFYAAITVTDNDPKPLSSQALVIITVVDVQEVPKFRQKEIPTTVLENSASGTVLSTVSLVADDPDIADAGKLVYSWIDADASSVFTLNPATAAVTVAPGAVLNYEVRSEYRFGVRVRDTASNTDTATLVVSIGDVNEPPTFSVVSSVAVWENITAGTRVLTMTATDEDTGSWGVLSFFLENDDGAMGAFRVDSSNGRLLVDQVLAADGVTRLLDFENRTTYNLVVGVRDAGGLSKSATVQLTLKDVNDIQVIGFALRGVDPTGRSVAPTGSMTAQGTAFVPGAALSADRVDLLVPTSGNVPVWLIGRGFGPTAFKLANEMGGVTASEAHPFIAKIVSRVSSNKTASASCTLMNDTHAACTIPSGAGARWSWDIAVGGTEQVFNQDVFPRLTVFRPLTGYLAPTITRVYRESFNPSLPSFMPTIGGSKFIVEGTDLGDPTSGFEQMAQYGPVAELWLPEYGAQRRQDAQSCRSVVAHEKMECTSRPGLGARLEFLVRVEAQVSAAFIGNVAQDGMRYATPAVSSVAIASNVTAPVLVDTAGNTLLLIKGSNFGPDRTVDVRVWYGEAGFQVPAEATPLDNVVVTPSSLLRFEAKQCQVVGGKHDTLQCLTVEGVGKDLVLAVAMRGLASAVPSSVGSSPRVGYLPPVVKSSSGSGWSASPTKGGVGIVFTGSHFGPAGMVTPEVWYGPSGNRRKYKAVSCRVSASHSEVSCNTAAGSGRDHKVILSIRGQETMFNGNWEDVPVDPIAFEAGTNTQTYYAQMGLAYAPPVVTRYDDVGSSDANTKGNETVVIEGLNFGPDSSMITRVTYGLDSASAEFLATNCFLEKAHEKIRCRTAEGAGAGLKWIVWVDGQQSRSPTTDYHEPVIESIQGVGSSDAYSDGGQVVDIFGQYFGPSPPRSYLEDVTYGRTGHEFVADSCEVKSHTHVQCKTVAGTGRGLRWRMSVRGQDSGLSTIMTNYADPVVKQMVPTTGSTAGQRQVRLRGTDFGVTESRVGQVFKFFQPYNVSETGDLVIPGLAGAVPCTGRICVLWNDQFLLQAENTSAWTVGQGAVRGGVSTHSLGFHVPEGVGMNIPVRLVLKTGPGGVDAFGEVRSAPVMWSYAPPVINSDIGKERVRVNGRVLIKLTVEGENFGADPAVYIYDDPQTFDSKLNANTLDELRATCTILTPHGKVECVQERQSGYVRVGAGGQYSAARQFDRNTPTVGNLEGSEWAALRLPTAGGMTITFEAHSIELGSFAMAIEGRPCQSLTISDKYAKEGDLLGYEWYKISCVTPAGRGLNQRLTISSAGLTPPPTDVNFAAPSITTWRATTGWQPGAPSTPQGLPPTQGSYIEITGGNFSEGCMDLSNCLDLGLSLYNADTLVPLETQFTLVNWTHTRIVARLPEGEGKGYRLRVAVAGQEDTTPFAYAAPSISSHTLGGPTAGGVAITVQGTNFGVSKPTITMRRPGGKAFRSDSMTPWREADLVLACEVQTWTHTEAVCTLPAGQGRLYKFEIAVAGQFGTFPYALTDEILDTQTFAYERPSITLVGPSVGPTQGSFLTGLEGSNLGTAELEVIVRVPASVPTTSSDWQLAYVTPVDLLDAVKRTARKSMWVMNDAADVFPSHTAAHARFALAKSDPAAALSALPSQDWRDAAMGIRRTAQSPNPKIPDPEEVDPMSLGVAGLLDAIGSPHQHDRVLISFPEGQGSEIEVLVNVAGQLSDPVAFSFLPPNITEVKLPKEVNTEGSWADEKNRDVMTIMGTSFGLNATQRTAVYLFRPASEYATVSRALQQTSTVAANSPFRPTAKEIADAVECVTTVQQDPSQKWIEAPLKVYSHTMIHCPVPKGWGRELRLTVKVMDRFSTPVSFSYDPAAVDYFTPNTPSALGTQLMTIFGKNFGPEPTMLDIRISGVACNGSSWVRDSSNRGKPYLKCIVAEDNAGVKNMTIFVAGQDALPVEADGRLRLICPYNYYGIEEPCLPCPIGGVCHGDLEWPYAAPGFWDLQPNNTIEAKDPYRDNCPAERLDSAHRSYCFYPVACKPNEACEGNNTCKYGYEGVRCKDCLKGQFYRRAGECVKCPDLPLVQLLAFLLAIMVAGLGAYAFQRFNIHLASIQIGIDYFQVLAMIARSKVPWPPLVRDILLVLSAFNLNLELAAPECFIPDLGYPLKWAMVALLPAAAFAMFGILHVLLVVKKMCMGRERKKLCNHSSAFVSSMLIMGYYAYQVETRNSLDVFNCSPTVPDDGFTYLESVIEKCGEPGGVQMMLAPWAGLSLIVYTFGYPAVVGYLLFTYRKLVQEDQVLRTMRLGNDRLTNPNAYTLRRKMAKVYQHMKPEYFFWVLCILARKAGVSVVALMFRENPAYQLSCALLVMFCSYAAQVRFTPYLSPATYDAEADRHRRLVKEGNPLHNGIANAIAPAVAYQRHQEKQKKRALWGMDAPSLRRVAVKNFFDYNTTEAVLLGCGVFTCLAGIMFQSGAFELGYRAEVAAQRDVVTWILTVVLILSILYVLVVVLNEAYAQFNRDKMVVDKKGGDKKKGGKKAGSSTGDLMADGDIIAGAAAEASSTSADSAQLNPMFMSGDGGASGVGRSADSIVESSAAPDTASWQVVRTEFQSLQSEVSELKKQLEMRSMSRGVTGISPRASMTRFAHSPMRAAGAASAGPDARLALAADAPGANPLFMKKGARRTGSRRGLMGKRDVPGSPSMAGEDEE
jgi:hypothetical protein